LGLRKVCLLVAMTFVASLSARAQGVGDKIELFGGYGYMHFKSTPASSLNGFNASGQWKFFDWLGAVADVGGEYGKVNGVNSQLYTFLFGPQISWPHRISPFAHALVGISRFSGGDFHDRSAGFAFGVGVDYHVSGRFSWRVIQADALTTRLGGRDEHNTRISTGSSFVFETDTRKRRCEANFRLFTELLPTHRAHRIFFPHRRIFRALFTSN
jgi:hypothetical protein